VRWAEGREKECKGKGKKKKCDGKGNDR